MRWGVRSKAARSRRAAAEPAPPAAEKAALAVLSRGPDAVRAQRADLGAKGFGTAVIDAVFDRDLETIGNVALDHRLSVGASGIGLGIARALVASARVKSSAQNAVPSSP